MMIMRSLIKFLLLMIFSIFIIHTISAQNIRGEKATKKIIAIKKMINDTNYIFIANTANP